MAARRSAAPTRGRQQQYYVAADGPQVAIYRGVQVDLPGLDLSSPYEVDDLKVEELPPFNQQQVEDGIVADDLEDAQRILENLVEQAGTPPTSPATSRPTSRRTSRDDPPAARRPAVRRPDPEGGRRRRRHRVGAAAVTTASSATAFTHRRRRGAELVLLLLRWRSASAPTPRSGSAWRRSCPADMIGYSGWLAALAVGAHVVVRLTAPYADPVLLPVVTALNGSGWR